MKSEGEGERLTAEVALRQGEYSAQSANKAITLTETEDKYTVYCDSKFVRWFNVYEDGVEVWFCHKTREAAEAEKGSGRVSLVRALILEDF